MKRWLSFLLVAVAVALPIKAQAVAAVDPATGATVMEPAGTASPYKSRKVYPVKPQPTCPPCPTPVPVTPAVPLTGDTSSFPEAFRWVVAAALLTLVAVCLPVQRKVRMFYKK